LETPARTFRLVDVRAAFNPAVFARGEAYARDGHVSALKITSDGHAIAADVAGSGGASYHVQVYISRARSGRDVISGHCECPVGMDCKHVAATLIAALERGSPDAMLSSEVIAPPRVGGVPAARQNSPDATVDRWLDGLRTSVGRAHAEVAVGDERIAYVFNGAAKSSRFAFPVAAVVVRRTKAERWAKIRDASVDSLIALTARAVSAEDAIIGRLMQLYAGSYGAAGSLADDIVRRMIATGRAYLDRLDTPPLTLGPPRPAHITWVLLPNGTQLPTLALDEPHLVMLSAGLHWYADPEMRLAGPADAGVPAATLAAFLGAPALDAAQAKRVRANLAVPIDGLAVPPPLEIVERVVRLKPVPVLMLRTVELPTRPVPRGSPRMLGPETIDIAAFWFEYGSARVGPDSPGDDVRHLVGTESVVYARSRTAENKASRRLAKCGFVQDPDLQRHLGLAPALCLQFVDEFDGAWPMFVHRTVGELRDAGWRVEIDPSFRHRIVDLADDAVWQPTVEERTDGWFDLGIGLDVNGRRVDLLGILGQLLQRSDALGDPALLANMGPDDCYYVRLGESNTSLAFPAARLRAIVSTLVELYDPTALQTNGTLRFPAVRAAVVNELEAAAGLRWDVPQRLRTLAERLRTFRGVARVELPASFKGELRPYQRDGLDWLQFLAGFGFGGILADDMGLGKSVQTLAHLLCEKEAGRLTQPALLVVPTSLVHNWCDEAARFAPTLRVLPLHGPSRAERFAQIAEHDVVITTYALLARDAVVRERTWHAVILDEAQALKNPQAKVAQIAMGLRAEHRVCLTGTPVENHLGDLWSLFSIALPGALGDRKQFGRVFRTPIEKHANGERNRLLAARIAPFLLRRTKEGVAAELPAKTEIVQRVELVGAQRDLYETVRLAMHQRVRAEIEERGLARSQIVILDALLKLRQVCCDPRLLPKPMRKTADSVKLDHLLEMVPQMVEEGRRILLFSQFTSMLDLIAPALAARDIAFTTLTGKTTDRASVVKRFTSGQVPVFLISLKAGGTGLNLTAADTVIHYDPWWNPAVERQATDRAHRIGQDKHVFVYKLIGAGTVEEKIVELQTRKAQLAAAIFSENGASTARFAAEDVERLFAPLDAGLE
jgi:superfamily II DNA or RNA helicase